MTDRLTEGERKSLYIALLTGLANEAQDRMCAADKQHAWGPWTRHQIQHDGPLVFDATGEFMDRLVHYRAERKCLNCGKEQHD